MRLRIKICGLKYAENIQAVAALQPDYMGFIFYPRSLRYVGREFQLPGGRPWPAARVGVFVNENHRNIIYLARQHRLTHLQLHGNETPEFCAKLYQAGFTIIKAFGLHGGFDFRLLQAYKGAVHYFLFDTLSEGYGGTGKTFNWTLLNGYQLDVPFFLSGGLSAEVLKQNTLPAHPQLHALDINSGVEDRPGWKNTLKIQELLHIIKQYDHEIPG
jgi:phosphoribosylanthranilate isomerase